VWNVEPRQAHQDNIEMSGKKVSVIVTYGVDEMGKLAVSRHVVFPLLRFQPNKTRDQLMLTFGEDAAPRLFIDQAAPRAETVARVRHKGLTSIEGSYGRGKEVQFTRVIFPSIDKQAVIDRTTLTNRSDKDVVIEVEDNERNVRTNAARGIYGGYVATSQIVGAGQKTLKPGESLTYALVISARKVDEPAVTLDLAAEQAARENRVESLLSKIQLETPDRVLNTMFAFAKIRAAESIYETKGGLMHGPGGGAYYAAIWANDQAEYANPFFAYLGDEVAVQSAINAYRHFAHYMNPEYRSLPSSIVAEGANTWQGAKDRGDAAMIGYGASRFALAYGRKETAEELWPLIEWCLEYCHRKIDARGVVASDSDELEGRFPAGNANLCTSSLYYDALRSAAMLGRDLGKPPAQLTAYQEQAKTLRAAIEKHFGATVEGFTTYRYFDKQDLGGNPKWASYAEKPDVLRAWICIPLTMDIFDRADGTIKALFSPRLWTKDGLATQAGENTFWDRSTLYALRGVFAAGEPQKALDFLTYYSNRRLLGDHVPYAVEAFPEGNQRHLSAESALYCRIYTEGLFGLRPSGLKSFNCTPRLPQGWPNMMLRHVDAFGRTFDLKASRNGAQLTLQVDAQGLAPKTYSLKDGETVAVDLSR
jgi:hypothetical protein